VEAVLSQFDVTPSRKSVLEALSQKYNSQHVVIDKIEHPFGSKVAKLTAKVYASAEALKEYDFAYKLVRAEGKKNASTEKAKKT